MPLDTHSRAPAKRPWLLLFSLFLIVLGSRAALIHYAGNSTPFMDEWDGDAAGLIVPYVDGRLAVSDLFAPFNEHRIVFTRLLVLSLLRVSGYWDVVLQMIVNAVLDSAMIVAAAFALTRILKGPWAAAAMIPVALINAIPYGYDNVLLGFNTHFYLLIGFSLLSLFLLVNSEAGSPRWIGGIASALASFFCMASGALTLAVALALHLLQAALGRRSGGREWLGMAALAGITAILIAFVPHVPASDVFRAHSVGQFLWALARLLSWPGDMGVELVLIVPSVIFVYRALVDRAALHDPRWFNVAVVGWVLCQILSLAAGRAQYPMQSRYFDGLLIGQMVNIVSLFWLVTTYPVEFRFRDLRSWAAAVWAVLVVASMVHPLKHTRESIRERRDLGVNEEQALRRYLSPGNTAPLSGRPALDIPYLKSDRLQQLVDTPEIRERLPPELLSREAPSTWAEAFKRAFLRFGFGWLGLGLLFCALSLVWDYEPGRIRNSRSKDFT